VLTLKERGVSWNGTRQHQLPVVKTTEGELDPYGSGGSKGVRSTATPVTFSPREEIWGKEYYLIRQKIRDSPTCERGVEGEGYGGYKTGGGGEGGQRLAKKKKKEGFSHPLSIDGQHFKTGRKGKKK